MTFFGIRDYGNSSHRENGDSMEFCDTFIREKHIKYIVDVGNEKDTLAAVVLASIALKSRSRQSICG